ncbi:MAG: T9SS type A sorting domain-containing protein [Candidatus Hatepunaea meridiana]|nr:T9SS type A sorting domain-containing protein [Candidatus Hatepunaea meridiana]
MRCIMLLILSTLLLSAATGDIYAQTNWLKWSPVEGVPVRQGNEIKWTNNGATCIEGERAGETAIVWEDTRNGFRNISIQIIEADGEFHFPEGGVNIFESSTMRYDPVICSGPDGDWFIAWMDVQTGLRPEIRCTRINADGEPQWGADENGISLENRETSGYQPAIISDDNGGCIILWWGHDENNNREIFAMHVLENGEPDENWADGGLPIPNLPGYDLSYNIASDGEGGIIISWLHYLENYTPILMIQRLSINGELLWGDGEAVQICDSPFNGESPKIVSDGDGGAIIEWMDSRNEDDRNTDIYVQRVDSEGNTLWEDNGSQLISTEDFELAPQLVPVSQGEAISVWYVYRQENRIFDIYAMRFGGNDELEKFWEPEEGLPIVVEQDGERERIDIFQDGEGGVFITWVDGRNGGYSGEYDIYAQRLNTDGEPLWGENGIPVSTADGKQDTPLIAPVAGDGCLVVWANGQFSVVRNIQAQILDSEGEAVWDEDSRAIVNADPGSAYQSRLVKAADDVFAVGFIENCFVRSTALPKVKFYRDLGNRVECLNDEGSITVVDNSNIGFSELEIAADGEGGVIVFWSEYRENNRSVFAQRITQEGERLWDNDGVSVFETEGEIFNPIICSDEMGGVFIACNYFRVDMQEILLQHLNADGERLWGNEDVRLLDENSDMLIQGIIPDGENGAAVLYSTINRSEYGLHINRITANGEPVWGNGDGIDINSSEEFRQDQSRMLKHPDGYAVIWQQNRWIDNHRNTCFDVLIQFVDTDGNTLWDENGIQVCNLDAQANNPFGVVDEDGYIWVLWSDDRLDEDRAYSLYLQKIDPLSDENDDPSFMLEENGQQVISAEGSQYQSLLIPDDDGGVWAAWTDSRRQYETDIYATHLDSQGERCEGWADDGNIVCDAIMGQSFPRGAMLRSSGETGIILLWDDWRSSRDEDEGAVLNLYCQRVDDPSENFAGDAASTAPVSFEITALYPNPFNSNVRIDYKLEANQQVSLKVFDLSGRLIFSADPQLRTIGSHSLTLDAVNWASGIYIAQLNADKKVRTKRFVCLK